MVTSWPGVACLLPRAARTHTRTHGRTWFSHLEWHGAPKCQTEEHCRPPLPIDSFFSQSHSSSQCLLTTHHVPGSARGLGGEPANRAPGTRPEPLRTEARMLGWESSVSGPAQSTLAYLCRVASLLHRLRGGGTCALSREAGRPGGGSGRTRAARGAEGRRLGRDGPGFPWRPWTPR